MKTALTSANTIDPHFFSYYRISLERPKLWDRAGRRCQALYAFYLKIVFKSAKISDKNKSSSFSFFFLFYIWIKTLTRRCLAVGENCTVEPVNRRLYNWLRHFNKEVLRGGVFVAYLIWKWSETFAIRLRMYRTVRVPVRAALGNSSSCIIAMTSYLLHTERKFHIWIHWIYAFDGIAMYTPLNAAFLIALALNQRTHLDGDFYIVCAGHFASNNFSLIAPNSNQNYCSHSSKCHSGADDQFIKIHSTKIYKTSTNYRREKNW